LKAAIAAHKANDAEAFRDAAARFRLAWLALVPNPRLVRVIEQYSDHMHHIRAMTLGDPEVRAIVLHGLTQVQRALAKGDGDAAAAAMHDNLREARKAFIEASGLDKEV
jgi:DNA-binding GntR family transcriptional regulator